jgi:hypothetical protein
MTAPAAEAQPAGQDDSQGLAPEQGNPTGVSHGEPPVSRPGFLALPAWSIGHDPATHAPGPGLNTPRQESGRRKRMPHTEDCSIRTRSCLEEVTGLRLSLSDTRRRDFTENAEIGQWQFLQDAIVSVSTPELGSPGPMAGETRAVSFSHFDRIWESEAPAEPLHFPQITDWLGRSLALPRE